MNQQAFVQKWRTLVARPDFTEIAYYQQHLMDLCQLVGHPLPAGTDTANQPFRFERRADKEGGGTGRADVWFRGHFAVEYKGPGDDLTRAYHQLNRYREALENPPLLIVCDFARLEIHTNFTGTVAQVYTLTLDDLLTNEGLRTLHNVFFNVESFRPGITPAQVTEEAAARFGRLASHLGRWGNEPYAVAHYLIRLLFCLFAEDIDLLPRGLFSRLVADGGRDPQGFNKKVRALFRAMAVGEPFGADDIAWFNGGLFNDERVIDLDADALAILAGITQLDWSAIEPAILGTLFTRSLDPQERAKLGAQYTSKEDILLIVEPVLMEPLRRAWAALQGRLREMAARRDAAPNRAARTGLTNQMAGLLAEFSRTIRGTRVLDPASGSGNFLYISLRLLLDLEKEVSNFAGEVELQPFFPGVSPEQLYGIEVNDYAHELAQATVWIGYLQWLHENGYGFPAEPVLKAMDNIKHMDAILQYDAEGKPVEPEWPAADVIVGNPPFLGDKRMISELGEKYVQSLRSLYADRVAGGADLVTYWFEKAHKQLANGLLQRAGLLATQSIRFGLNRRTLERIKNDGDIFFAESDRAWVLEGAAVRVSMVGFDTGLQKVRWLNGVQVADIYADLTAAIDLTVAQPLSENSHLSFIGTQKSGPFELSAEQATHMLAASNGPEYGSNAEIVKKWLNADAITSRNPNMWIIDFGTSMSLDDAKRYLLPFNHVQTSVKPLRDVVRRKGHREKWWLFGESRPGMRRAIAGLNRYIVSPRVAKHRLFTWVDAAVIPDSRLVVIARNDDYFFGVLHSGPHEIWTLAKSSWHGVGNDPTYNTESCFETYPFPWPPGQEPQEDGRVLAIAQAGRELVALRDAWLNPPDLSGAELNKRTLTNLYNARPEWLDAAHKRLDAAVCAAYGWPDDLADEEILARLLALNLERAGNM